jgi:hypothetical protein
MLLQQLLNLVAVFQQMRSVNPELARQVGGRHSLSHPAQNQDNRGTTVAGLTPQCIRKHIEDRAAGLTPVIYKRSPMTIMCPLFRRQEMTRRTVQTLGVQHREQVVVASLHIHQRLDWKRDHARSSPWAMKQLLMALEDTRFRNERHLCTSEAT